MQGIWVKDVTSENNGNGVRVKWVVFVGACSVLFAGLAFGSIYAALPSRVQRLETSFDALSRELRDGRAERLINQGEVRARLDVLIVKTEAMGETLKKHVESESKRP